MLSVFHLEYNPLMGGGSGSSGVCFRPARRGAGGG